MNADFDPQRQFPFEFTISVLTREGNFSKKFIQIAKDLTHPISSDKIFTITDVTDSPREVKLNPNETEEWELYNEFNGKSAATLIRNKNGSKSQPFRMVRDID